MIVISGYFGKKLTGVYTSLPDVDCFFFSNNKEMKSIVEAKGWIFVSENMPISAEPRIASLQSKYVKFLQFDKEKIGWKRDQEILYFDHKFEVKITHVKKIENSCDTALLIRNTPKEKLTIQDEINDALPQKRYAEVMEQTIAWVNNKIENEGYRSFNRIMNTGLIFTGISKRFNGCAMRYMKTAGFSGSPNVKSFGVFCRSGMNII